jgi:hypothetical protein
MKREAGLMSASVLAVAAMYSAFTFHSKEPGEVAPAEVRVSTHASSKSAHTRTNGSGSKAVDLGPCHETVEKLSTFFELRGSAKSYDDPPHIGPPSCGALAGKVLQAGKAPRSIRFVIAAVPDPETQLPFIFDREIEAIQQGAQNVGYVYDSSWMPWESEHAEFPLVGDQDTMNNRREMREGQPGIILFRRSAVVEQPQGPTKHIPPAGPNASTIPNAPYDDALVIFIVGEDATAGIHREQFRNAIGWIARLETLAPTHSTSQILAPYFSGSFPSLGGLLQEHAAIKVLKQQPGHDYLDIFSGTVSSTGNVAWFVATTKRKPLEQLNINFHSFQLGDSYSVERFIDYLVRMGTEPCHVAILSEDQTAYGNPRSNTQPKLLVDAPRFTYPRDISGLRASYQDQAILGTSSSSESSHHSLRGDIADPQGKLTDGIRRYGGDQTALTQEAVLLQLVSMFHAHQTQFIILRSSNQLDQLFLTRFFKQAYPEGRVVLLGNDLLLRRDIISSGMNGVITLSVYPLLPDIDHWTSPDPAPGPSPDPAKLHSSHAHRAFTYESAQGTFLALSFLLAKHAPETPQDQIAGKKAVAGKNPPSDSDPPDDVHDSDSPCLLDVKAPNRFLPRKDPSCNDPGLSTYLPTPGYGAPVWLKKVPLGDSDSGRPVVWVSVLGNDGFWPVASLDGELPFALSRSRSILTAVEAPWQTVFGNEPPDSRYPLSIPFSLEVFLAIVLLWALANFYCCAGPSLRVKPVYRSYFVRPRVPPQDGESAKTSWFALPRQHIGFIVAAAFFVVAAANILAWSYGWASSSIAEPFQQDRTLFALGPFLIWSICAAAIAVNTWQEHHLALGNHTPNEARRTSFCGQTWKPLLLFTTSTFAFFSAYVIFVDRLLTPQIRTPTYLRAMNLVTGVSPAAPLFVLTLGMYGWCWYSLRGLSVLGMGNPLLPSDASFCVRASESGATSIAAKQDLYQVLSADSAGRCIEELCKPISALWVKSFFAVYLALTLMEYLVTSHWMGPRFIFDVPIRNLGPTNFAKIVCACATVLIAIVLVTCWQLRTLWLVLHEMLMALDRLPLRRTLQSMRGLTWNSVWKLGGDIVEFRYKLIYRQFDALDHVAAGLKHASEAGFKDWPECANLTKEIEATQELRLTFQDWCSRSWNDWRERDLTALYRAQDQIACVTGSIFSKLLLPAWEEEEHSLLILKPTFNEFSDDEGEHIRRVVDSVPVIVRNAEEAFCLLYIGFIQNILARMRTLALGMTCLFVSFAVMVPSYPFDPRPLLTGTVIVLFVIIALVVFSVYSQMSRDATLSHLTDTKPGELGADFWLKFIGFGIGPIFGLLATIFPQLGDFFTSWLQPSISSLR